MKRNRHSYLIAILSTALGIGGCGSGSMAGGYKSADSPAAESVAGQSQAYPQGAAPAPGDVGAKDSAPSATSGSEGASVRQQFEPQEQPKSRPGLGTEWGETRTSRITTSPFVRADASQPVALASFNYNDAQGAKAMANASGFRELSTGKIDVGNGLATVMLKDGNSGRFLSGFEAASKSYMVGQAGDRYTIVVQSNVPARLEVLVSVDGLDVLDGRAAGFSKRGYLIDPNGTLEIDGFRQSADAVAAFRFGSVRESYAQQKHGDARNVGVIGVALFHEQGSNPLTWNRGEVQQRLDANPFPGQFATPPQR